MALVAATLLVGHWRMAARVGAPPERLMFDGLPVTGSLGDARREGFTYCLDFITTMRCRRSGVMLMNHGPFSAAVDLDGRDGRGGFRQIILWHDREQTAPSDLARDLEAQGWHSCLTARHNWGDQNILRRAGSPVRISIDLSYYAKRRIRIIPEKFASEPVCS
jgi:hypothetical protein